MKIANPQVAKTMNREGNNSRLKKNKIIMKNNAADTPKTIFPTSRENLRGPLIL